MDTKLAVYQHSGRLGGGVVAVPVAAVVSAVVLSFAYAYADVYSPIAGYVSVILVLLFGGATGVCISYAARYAKCRNTRFVIGVAVLAGLLAFYTQWVVFLFAYFQRGGVDVSLTGLFVRPGAVWNLVKLVNENGWYSLRSGGNVTGTVLWVFWAIEFLIIVISIPLLSTYALTDRVFCERCEAWCTRHENHFRLGLGDDTDLLVKINEGDLDAMEKLPTVPAGAAPALRVDLHRCDTCRDTAAMLVKLVTPTREKDGSTKEEERELTPCYLLDAEQRQRIEALADRPPVEPVDSEPEPA
jgi:hypothetical protein